MFLLLTALLIVPMGRAQNDPASVQCGYRPAFPNGSRLPSRKLLEVQRGEFPWQEEKSCDRCWMAQWAPARRYGRYGGVNMQLERLRVSQIRWKACSKRVQRLSRTVLCAWQEPDTNGNCQGDSGAPLVCANWGTQKFFQVGVFSWGMSSSSRGRTGMFVSVAQFIPWIQEELQKEGRAYALSGAQGSSLAVSPQYLLLLGLASQMLLAAMLT